MSTGPIRLEPSEAFDVCIVMQDGERLVYSEAEVIRILEDMFRENGEQNAHQCAVEWFHFNIESLSHMKNGPLFVDEEEEG